MKIYNSQNSLLIYQQFQQYEDSISLSIFFFFWKTVPLTHKQEDTSVERIYIRPRFILPLLSFW